MDFDRNGAGPLPTPSDGVPARGQVARARFVGNQSIVELAMEHDGSMLKATIPGVFLPKPGTPLWLSLRRDRCFVFPCRCSARSRTRISAEKAAPRRRLGFACARAEAICTGRAGRRCAALPDMETTTCSTTSDRPASCSSPIVVLVLFGRGKVSGLMGEVGKGITSFKRGLNDGKAEIENAARRTNARDITPEKEKV